MITATVAGLLLAILFFAGFMAWHLGRVEVRAARRGRAGVDRGVGRGVPIHPPRIYDWERDGQ